MQMLMINRRNGEGVPINPLQVVSVRRQGEVTSVKMADGEVYRTHASLEAVLDAVEKAAGRTSGEARLTVEDPPPAPPQPKEAAPAADEGPSEEEEAELQTRGQRASHDDGEPPAKDKRK